jgi:UDP-3-O-[3-hydroxymyristoyl] glucosamine N-acyltransferase
MPTLADIAAALDVPAPALPHAGRSVRGVATVEDAGEDDITFASSDSFAKGLVSSRALAVIAQKNVTVPPSFGGVILAVADADLAVAKVLELYAPPVPRPPAGVDLQARVARTATFGEGAAVGPFACVGERTRVGNRSVLHAVVFVGDDVVIGDDCELFPQVVVRERITIGNRVVIHAGSVLGTDGFGYRWDGGKHAKIPQIGTVIVEDDVEIGSCVCVDRAKFSATLIGKGTKIDNLVQVAHNVRIGPHCIIVGQVGLAGSARLGAGVVLGGQVAVRDHVTMGDGAMAAATAGVVNDVPAKTVVSGVPALPHRQTLREQASLRHLPELRNQVKKLQEEIEALKAKLETPPST